MKDTFTLWGVQCRKTGDVVYRADTRKWAQAVCAPKKQRVVKLECRIVPRKSKPKRGKYPNDNYGLPANYTPHNPDNLTREQVGEGFRLLATVEIWRRPGEGLAHIHRWVKIHWSTLGWWGQITHCTYRVPINTPLDITPPVEPYPADFEQAFAEAKLDAKDKAAAFELWKKGGAR